MKILMLNYEFPPLGGGASPVSYEVAKGYVRRGHLVDVVTMGFRGLPHYEQKDGINIYRVRCWRSKKEICHPWEQFTYIFSAMLFLKSHFKRNVYDINHTHFIIPTGIISLWLKKKFGLPYIVSSHGSDVPGFNSDRFVFLHKFTGPLLRKVCDNALKVVALSDYLKQLIHKNIAEIGPDKLVKIPNGIDPFKYLQLPKQKIILSTGRLLPRKGFQHLIRAVSENNIGYEVHICGDGPMMLELKKLATRSKTKVLLHGWISNESAQYKELLGKAAIYCLLSSKENASIALLEAMSAGCAVITSNVSGCPETVGDAGITLNPEDESNLSEIINSLIENEAELNDIQTRARERVIMTYDWDKIIGQYLQLFNKQLYAGKTGKEN